jgi:hypothetical protein
VVPGSNSRKLCQTALRAAQGRATIQITSDNPEAWRGDWATDADADAGAGDGDSLVLDEVYSLMKCDECECQEETPQWLFFFGIAI